MRLLSLCLYFCCRDPVQPSFLVRGLLGFSAYVYTVQAVNGQGSSAPSEASRNSVTLGRTPPSPPRVPKVSCETLCARLAAGPHCVNGACVYSSEWPIAISFLFFWAVFAHHYVRLWTACAPIPRPTRLPPNLPLLTLFPTRCLLCIVVGMRPCHRHLDAVMATL